MLLKLGHGLGGCMNITGSGDVSPYLDGVIASVCCDLDATVAVSYGGSGETWANLIATPADGAAQTGYDFYLGLAATTDGAEPSFTGTAGDAAAYFACDGGDYFTIKNIANAPTLAKAHRSDVNGTWIAFAWRSPASPAGYVRMLGSELLGPGITLRYDNLELFDCTAGNGTSVSLLASDVASVSADTDYLIIVSWDGTGSTDNARIWINQTTATATTSVALQTSTVDNTDGFLVGACLYSGAVTQPLQNGSRIYHFSAGNEFLDDTKAAAIIAHLETRHVRNYTP